MAELVFTPQLQRFLACAPQQVEPGSVRDALEQAFEALPRLRGYILNDQGGLRRHIAVFVDGRQISDRRGLSDAVAAGSEIYVMQALSGG